TGGTSLAPIPPPPVPAEGAQRQPALPAELAPAQAACFELRHQTLDPGPAQPAPYHAHLFFIHAPTSSSNSSQEQMGWSDAYVRSSRHSLHASIVGALVCGNETCGARGFKSTSRAYAARWAAAADAVLDHCSGRRKSGNRRREELRCPSHLTRPSLAERCDGPQYWRRTLFCGSSSVDRPGHERNGARPLARPARR